MGSSNEMTLQYKVSHQLSPYPEWSRLSSLFLCGLELINFASFLVLFYWHLGNKTPASVLVKQLFRDMDIWITWIIIRTNAINITSNKSGVKRLNTLGQLDQYMAQHGRIVKQPYLETV